MTCSLPECTKPHLAKGFCRKHYTRWRRYNNPNVVHPKGRPFQPGHKIGVGRPPTAGAAKPGKDHRGWKGDAVSYSGAHYRVRKEHGKASEWHCAYQCGRKAYNWAFCHDAENPLTDEQGRMYSGDPYDYVPLCVPCHRVFDGVS